MAISTAIKIADAFLYLPTRVECPEQLSNLKLQKLLYYAQAWHLVFNDAVLFDDDIEAWVHGPVVPEIFRIYKPYKWHPIDYVGAPVESEDIANHLLQVWKAYGKFSATDLERLTHSEAPWKEARGGLPPDVSSHNVITTESMKQYYSSLL